MKNILNRLIQHEVLSRQESKDILVGIANKAYNESEIASFLTVYMMRSIQLEELEGFRDALLELCLAVDLSAYEPIDLSFRDFDVDNSGMIDKEEFLAGFRSINAVLDQALTDDQIISIMQFLDKDGDGNVSYEEFLGGLRTVDTAATRA